MSIIISGFVSSPKENISTIKTNLRSEYSLPLGDDILIDLYKESIDARHKQLSVVRSFKINGLSCREEQKLCERYPNIKLCSDQTLNQILNGYQVMDSFRPVVVGLGPSGMFAALVYARLGLRPIVIEQGNSIDQRDLDVEHFKKNRILNEFSNVQFGEGGAGTYSDGKLTSRINDPFCFAVLNEFFEHGAPHSVLTKAHPHIGTDILKKCVRSIDEEIIRLGGEIHFSTTLLKINYQNGKLKSIFTSSGEIECSKLILAIGHSSDKTYESLVSTGIQLIPKNFAMGFRIEHLQSHIDHAVYGNPSYRELFGAAEYNVSHRSGDIGCFSFCMCPGGYICASQSELQTIVTNGMSYSDRNGINGNSAIAVSCNTSDFPSGVLGGVLLKKSIEQKAFILGGKDYSAPSQLLNDFMIGKPSCKLGNVKPTYPLGINLTDLSCLYPPSVIHLMKESIPIFSRKYSFFNDPDAVLTGPETRTSSPVRIQRNPNGESVNCHGLYPCGEGAGYAGGIMSAAVDGIKQALLSVCTVDHF